MSWWWISPRSRPCSPTSGRSSPRTRASSICAPRPTASSSTRVASARRRTTAAPALRDIDAALKLTGTAGSLVYGAFVAQEDDYDEDFGRLFRRDAAARCRSSMRASAISARGLIVRCSIATALVNALDYEITPNDWWRVAGQLIRSDIDSRPGLAANRRATKRGCRPISTAPRRSSHTLKLLYIDDRFDMNDLGYMERNSLHQVEWDTNRRVARARRRRASAARRSACTCCTARTTSGERLQSRIQLSRDVQYASDWRSYEELRFVTERHRRSAFRAATARCSSTRASAPTPT